MSTDRFPEALEMIKTAEAVFTADEFKDLATIIRRASDGLLSTEALLSVVEDIRVGVIGLTDGLAALARTH